MAVSVSTRLPSTISHIMPSGPHWVMYWPSSLIIQSMNLMVATGSGLVEEM